METYEYSPVGGRIVATLYIKNDVVHTRLEGNVPDFSLPFSTQHLERLRRMFDDLKLRADVMKENHDLGIL